MKAYFLLLVLMTFAGVNSAVDRVVSFAGTGFNHVPPLDNTGYIEKSFCVVTVANTGTTSQRVRSISVSTISRTNINETSTTNVESDFTTSMISNPAGGSICAPGFCWGTLGQIDPGGVYLGVGDAYPVRLSNIDFNPCFGQIVVYDATDGQMGSVVATGAINYYTVVGRNSFRNPNF